MVFTFQCRDCDKELYVDDEHVSESGKKIPLEYDGYNSYSDSAIIHDCPAKPPWTSEPFDCDDCGESLYVSDTYRSKKGKRIPMNEDDDKPHRCPERDHSFPCKWCNQPIEVLDEIVSERLQNKRKNKTKRVGMEMDGLRYAWVYA